MGGRRAGALRALALQLGPEARLLALDVGAVGLKVDEWVGGVAGHQRRVLVFEVEERGVGPQREVAGQRAQGGEASGEVPRRCPKIS